ncbi:MAG: pyrroloquinoline quinone biosynthesis peptide chaperone PqqD [Anaerolineae bacterium]|nr:pyrroloquinoline quinone biosynthesis peptide chaperone PqqD [Anaerolineae bacterium]
MERKPKRNLEYRLEEIDGELLLFHPGDTKMVYCNQTASLIWQLCDGTRSVQQIIDLLAAAYPEAAESIAEDVNGTLQQFEQHGAIQLQ